MDMARGKDVCRTQRWVHLVLVDQFASRGVGLSCSLACAGATRQRFELIR